MNPEEVLAAFDRQIRRNPQSDGPGGTVERDDRVIRGITPGDGWNGVTWSDLDATSADEVIAAQLMRFAGREWEWKYYSYDLPADLPARLMAAGFTPEPVEALLVAEVAELALHVPPPPGVELRPVIDEGGVAALVQVQEQVFGSVHTSTGATLRTALKEHSTTVAAVVAYAGSTPIAAGRMEFHEGTDFASLWGGGTLQSWRGQGVFRSLVAHRAALASARGFRYLQVDASADSRPILKRLGFVELASTTPFTHSAGE
jgi:GNAT superfamily N-acetyltransferase